MKRKPKQAPKKSVVKKRRGREFTPSRWTISRAAMEFDINEMTLRKRLRQTSAEVGEDGCFSTAQICSARFGDYEVARARNEAAKADLAELAYRERCGELVEVRKVIEDDGEVITAAKNIIMNSGMSRLEKRKTLEALAALGSWAVNDEGDATGN